MIAGAWWTRALPRALSVAQMMASFDVMNHGGPLDVLTTIPIITGPTMLNDYLVLTNSIKACRRCKEPTYWALESQLAASDMGLCLDHARQFPMRDEPYSDSRQIVKAFVKTFAEIAYLDVNESQSVAERPTTVMGTWVCSGRSWRSTVALRPPFAGAGVRAPPQTHRYGLGGEPLCVNCRL